MRDSNELVDVVFSGLSALVVEDVSDDGDLIRVTARTRDEPVPCPVCGAPVQQIRYAENEANYCATCQTGGRVLADRALSRLLRDDWPRSLEEWDAKLG